MSYQALIAEAVGPGYDPRHVEAFMRIDTPTLDHLSRDLFFASARIAAQAVDLAGVEEAEALAVSMGFPAGRA